MGRVAEPTGAQVHDPPQGATRQRQAAGTPSPKDFFKETYETLPPSHTPSLSPPVCLQYGAEVRAVVERRHHDGTYTVVHRDDQNNRIAVRLRRERITLLDPPTPTPPVPSKPGLRVD